MSIPPPTDNNPIISYHSHVLRFHPFSFVWRIFFCLICFFLYHFHLSMYFIFCSLLYKGFLNKVQIFPSEDILSLGLNDLKLVLDPQTNARHLTWLKPVLISTKAAHKFSSQCCLSAAYLATAAHMQEPLWCCWMQNDGFYMSTMQKTITPGKQLLRSLGEWWARSLQLLSSADILFSDKMIQAGPEMVSGRVSGGFSFKAFSET